MMAKNNSQQPVKVYISGFFRSYWIAFLTVASTLKTSLSVIFTRKTDKKSYRAKVDKSLQSWGKRLLNILHTRITVVGKEHLQLIPGRAYMIMCSHTSNYDIPATFAVMPGSIRMLAKKELKKIPVFGRAIESSEMLFIDRQHKKQALKDLAKAKQKMEDGIILWVAPEGTRTIGSGKVGKLKKGGFHMAMDTEAIILPIAFRGIDNLQLRDRLGWHLHKTIECHIGTPIDSRSFSKKNINQLLERVESQFQTLVGNGQ